MSKDIANLDSQPASHGDEEISLLDLAIMVAKHKKLVLGLPVLSAIVAIVVSLLLPHIYSGVTRILPPQQNQSSAVAMLGQLTAQLGGLAGIAGGALGIKNPNDTYIGMLKSRTIADGLIERFNLKKVYEKEKLEDVRKVLDGNTRITSGKDNLIVVEFEDKDPERAAAIANGYIEELYKLTQSIAVTEASQRRLFFERQLAQAQKSLTEAETLARQGLEKGGLVIVDAQGRAMVETTARLRAQISVKEIQIGSIRSFAAEKNPDLQQALYELEAMKKELSRIEGATSDIKSANSDGAMGGMDNFKLLRETKYREAVVELLTKQYEIAKLDEARDASLIQVMDKAVVPGKRTKPKRTLIVLITVFVSTLLSIGLAIVVGFMDRARKDPFISGRFEELKGLLVR